MITLIQFVSPDHNRRAYRSAISFLCKYYIFFLNSALFFFRMAMNVNQYSSTES